MRPIRFTTLAGLGVAAALLLAGCGNQEITVSASEEGFTFDAVVSSSSSGISAVESAVAKSGASFTGTVANGDNHTGNEICSFSTSTGGNSYTVTWYASSLPSGVTASQMQSTLCSSSAEQSFNGEVG